MKKIAFLICLFLSTFVYAQQFTTVDVSDPIYDILDAAQLKGYCNFMPGAKPYTINRILNSIEEILENRDKLNKVEIEILEDYVKKYTPKQEKNLKKGSYRIENSSEKFPVSFQLVYGLNTEGSGGLYTDTSFDQYGFDIIPHFTFSGDFTKYFSYSLYGFFDITSMPLRTCGDYFIGYAWYGYENLGDGKESMSEEDVTHYLEGDKRDDGTEYPEPYRRNIVKKLNTSYLPYRYHKTFDGQVYSFKQLTAGGLNGWADDPSIGGGINAELNAVAFDNRFEMKFGRIYREWAGMDHGSSLVLNKNARPFTALELDVNPFDFIKYSFLTGSLEYPNQDFIIDNSYAGYTYLDDAYFFQNMYSINMIELDWKYFHFDFGSSVIWPKRIELGYLFPLVNYVLYQNNLGDYDNLALFGDIKVRKEGLGSIWASIYLEEVNGMNNNIFRSTRAMFAGQLGTKMNLKWLPFGTLSMRYTKVEPYCYTHQSINYTPWYAHYISENYTNNGYCLGYYLDPNSDETLVKLEMKPRRNISTVLQYQMIRHGADYGSQQVPGSSIYSELSNKNRDELEKYFLHDGAYNWMHIVSLGAELNISKSKIPVSLYTNIGFLYSYYTVIDDSVYAKRRDYGNNGNSGADENTSFHFVDNDEYPVQCGAVITCGIKIMNW